jgi:ATP/ADP translocase
MFDCIKQNKSQRFYPLTLIIKDERLTISQVVIIMKMIEDDKLVNEKVQIKFTAVSGEKEEFKDAIC